MVSKYSFRQELIKFINSIEWSNPIALTLTLKQRVFNHSLDLIQVTATIRHFMNRLNRKIFGNASKRYDKKLKLFPVIEHGADKRFHIHAIIDCPNKITTDQFNSKITESWSSIDYGYNHIHIQPIHNDGWTNYITKFQTKLDYALSIDWENVRTH